MEDKLERESVPETEEMKAFKQREDRVKRALDDFMTLDPKEFQYLLDEKEKRELWSNRNHDILWKSDKGKRLAEEMVGLLQYVREFAGEMDGEWKRLEGVREGFKPEQEQYKQLLAKKENLSDELKELVSRFSLQNVLNFLEGHLRKIKRQIEETRKQIK